MILDYKNISFIRFYTALFCPYRTQQPFVLKVKKYEPYVLIVYKYEPYVLIV